MFLGHTFCSKAHINLDTHKEIRPNHKDCLKKKFLVPKGSSKDKSIQIASNKVKVESKCQKRIDFTSVAKKIKRVYRMKTSLVKLDKKEGACAAKKVNGYIICLFG